MQDREIIQFDETLSFLPDRHGVATAEMPAQVDRYAYRRAQRVVLHVNRLRPLAELRPDLKHSGPARPTDQVIVGRDKQHRRYWTDGSLRRDQTP